MKINLISLFFLVCVSFAVGSKGQSLHETSYVVITFEDDYKFTQHGKTNYQWIIPRDSLKLLPSGTSMIRLGGFATRGLASCCQGLPTKLHLLVDSASFDFPKTYYQNIDNFERTVKNHRKLVQSITKKWSNGQKECIKVFIAPVKGHFCVCKYLPEKGNWYSGFVYVPNSIIEFDEAFWETEDFGEFFKGTDFSNIRFK